MLGFDHDPGASPLDWESIELRAALPSEASDFFERHGPVPVHADSRRGYARLYLRQQAVIRLSDGTRLAGYTTDVSRKGIGFLSPVQLFPKDRLSIRVANSRDLPIEVVRCRRLESNCYRCGATFAVNC